MKTIIIVQARMTSTRLPGKVMKEVLGKPLLEYQIERLKRVKNVDDIVIAVTTNDADAPIIRLCEKLGVSYYRGSEEDVLSRYYEAAVRHKADIVVRITSDCPLIDPFVVDKTIAFYRNNSDKYDYVSNCIQMTYPRGMDIEIFSFDLLKQAHENATKTNEREHVTPFLYLHPEKYRLGNYAYISDQSHHRWTVDTPQDFELIEKMIENLIVSNKEFSLEDCLSLFGSHPEWMQINSDVKQKTT